MYRPEEIIHLFERGPSVEEYEAQIGGFALVPIRQGLKVHVSFDDQDDYLVITSNAKQLFFKNNYYGGILVEIKYDDDRKTVLGKTIHTFYIRGVAAVLSNKCGQKFITPIDQNADIIWDSDEMSWDMLKMHFENRYAAIKKNYPRWFKESLDRLHYMDMRIVLVNNTLVAL